MAAVRRHEPPTRRPTIQAWPAAVCLPEGPATWQQAPSSFHRAWGPGQRHATKPQKLVQNGQGKCVWWARPALPNGGMHLAHRSCCDIKPAKGKVLRCSALPSTEGEARPETRGAIGIQNGPPGNKQISADPKQHHRAHQKT